MNLSNGMDISLSTFRGNNSKIIERLIRDGVLDTNLGNTKVICRNKENLANYLHLHFSIPSLEAYISLLSNSESTRSDAVMAASDSKIKDVKVLEGFLVNAYHDIKGIINGNEINLKPSSGSFIFINEFRDFLIPPDVTVVCVEGFENFRMAEKQMYLFEGIKPIFIWRYQNSVSIVKWLLSNSNNYIHFGDFDPKGLHIYVSEFRNKIGKERCEFLFPQNLEELLIKFGNKELYETQLHRLIHFDFESCPEILPIFQLLKKHKKGLEQEIFIK